MGAITPKDGLVKTREPNQRQKAFTVILQPGCVLRVACLSLVLLIFDDMQPRNPVDRRSVEVRRKDSLRKASGTNLIYVLFLRSFQVLGNIRIKLVRT